MTKKQQIVLCKRKEVEKRSIFTSRNVVVVVVSYSCYPGTPQKIKEQQATFVLTQKKNFLSYFSSRAENTARR